MVLTDSTGLKISATRQWLEAKHGVKSRRTWRKLHLAADAGSGTIVAQTLTDQDDDHPSRAAPLLEPIDGGVALVTADGAYDGAPTCATIATYGDDRKVMIRSRQRARGFAAQQTTEATIGVEVPNRMLAAGCPDSVCRTTLNA